MARDIDKVIERVRTLHSDVKIKQLEVAHPGVDDDGIWFFSIPADSARDIQIESASGSVPFLVEHSKIKKGGAFVVPTIDGTAEMISTYLTKLKNRANKPPQTTTGS